MRAVDTDVLVRLFTGDDPKQAAAADISSQAEFGFRRRVFAPEVVVAALVHYRNRPSPRFSDYLVFNASGAAGALAAQSLM